LWNTRSKLPSIHCKFWGFQTFCLERGLKDLLSRGCLLLARKKLLCKWLSGGGSHPQGCEPSHFVCANFSCPGSWNLLAPAIKPSQKHFHKKPQKKADSEAIIGHLEYLQSNLLKSTFTINCKRSWFRSYNMALEVPGVWLWWWGIVIKIWEQYFPCHYKQTSAPYLIHCILFHAWFFFFIFPPGIRSDQYFD
jgi:hypothetical protein